ncbi:MAG: Flp pilus assembly protein CpaB [Nevskiaceae bacterium]|nr:MAG: Flp pilus assembly protein CpaB [Nevskiaceae bacterium]TBR72060.1 MAG: Flp pilus assembly protein CpaB [Nevskiaceae bacterium]
MSSNAIKVTAVVLVILALALVFVAYRYSKSLETRAAVAQQQAAQQASGSADTKPTTQVVVASKPLPAQTKIGRLDVELVPLQSQVVPVGALTKIDDAIDRVPLQDVDKGTPLTARLFTDNNALAHSIPEGTQALSLRVDDVIGTGGFVQPGDHVDVLLYLRQQSAGANDEYKVQTQARVLLKDALVLAYQDLVVPPPEDMKKDGGKGGNRPTHAHTAVLAVPDADTTRVMLGASLGELRLALLRQVKPEVDASGAAAPAAQANPAAVKADATAVALNTMQASPMAGALPAAAPGVAPTAQAKPDPSKVITLEELGFIRARQQAQAQRARGFVPQRRAAPTVTIYRGDKVEAVRP